MKIIWFFLKFPLKTGFYSQISTQKFIFMLLFTCYHLKVKKCKIILLSIFLTFFISGCQTVKEKTDTIVEKENEKLSKYIGKSMDNLKIDLGNPDEDFKNLNGNSELVYRNKKFGISCERRFEVNSNLIVIGFISKGCF